MPGRITAVIGLQWGDEGKGRVVDYLISKGYSVVGRYNGGSNAGHTIYAIDKSGQMRKFALHLVPSGIMNEGVMNLSGHNILTDPVKLFQELSELNSAGIDTSNFYVSDRAPICTPYHKALEKAMVSTKKIGTTGSGMGPGLASLQLRNAIFMKDIFRPASEVEQLLREIDQDFVISERSAISLDYHTIAEGYCRAAEKIQGHLADTDALMTEYLKEGRSVVFEGAQGFLLDNLYGTYPFVTSSHPGIAGIPLGFDIPPSVITEVVGVMKAGYITRVGHGPFPTELGDEESLAIEEKYGISDAVAAQIIESILSGRATEYEIGYHLRRIGDEKGATTGRLRRTGWQDLVATRYSVARNDVDWVALTKLDVTDELPVIRMCDSYRNRETGILTRDFDAWNLGKYEPVYDDQKGWMTNTRNARTDEELPPQAKETVTRIEGALGVPAKIISVGPHREELICRD